MNPSKRKVTVLKQICNLVPRNLVQKLAKEHGVEKQSRTFSPWSHVVSLEDTREDTRVSSFI